MISPGGAYGTLVKVTFPRADIKQTWTLGYTAMGETIEKRGDRIEARSQDFEFVKAWVAEVEPMLHQGLITVHPTHVGRGLENVLDGIDRVRKGKVSGKKLVYTL